MRFILGSCIPFGFRWMLSMSYQLGYALDLWGVVVQDPTYEDCLKAHPMYAEGKLRLRGPFTSDDLSFIKGYDLWSSQFIT